MDLELSPHDIGLVVAIFIMGIAFNSARFILFLNAQDSFTGFLIYYLILYGVLFVLSKLDLIIFKPNIGDLQGSIGMLFLTFALFATINFENPYVQYVTTGSFTGASGVFYQAEDGVCWLLATQILHITDIEIARICAFGVIPAIVALIGLALTGGKVRIEV
jgi:hypothetical protein